MPIEKVFAINAPPGAVYDALERDLQGASDYAGATHDVLSRDPGRAIELRVTIGGIPCRLRYELAAADGSTEVTARLTPYGWRYAFFRTITFGLRDTNFAVALVEGLSNLKAAVEAESRR